ncbi:ABC transporter ATP-binding protein [Streptococcus merionis]|uniref:Putative ATP-binding/permease protein n=1 Tax=Streptococcus merionis TaxID=400065 RepID=A0A239SR18_9STRE|nr:ABC transporter ATP-binding protein [Streptococcus merionis]SNU87857.1 putative ATP-binding/permease protein [Streptococcus merionis]
MKALLVYFKDYVKEAFLGPLFKLLEALFELLVPLLIARIVDQIIPSKNQGDLVFVIVWLFILACLGVLVAITAQYFSAKAAVRYTQGLTDDLFAKVMRLPQDERDRLGHSSLVTRLSSDTFQIQTGINMFLRLFLRAPIIIVGVIVMAYVLNPQVSLIFVIMVGILFALVFGVARITAPAYQGLRQQLDRIVALTQEQLSGMRVVRAFSQTEREASAFAAENKRYQKKQITVGHWAAFLTPLTYLVVNLSLLVLLWRGNQLVSMSLLSQGSLIALVNYLLQILTELLKVAMLTTNLNQSFISAQRVLAVFEAPEEDILASLPQVTAAANKAILLDHATFQYPSASEPALSDVTLSLESGQILGVIGGTGSGKSTLVQLLSGLRQISAGRIALFCEGRSPENLTTWREWTAVVPQKAQLFRGTVRENLLLGMTREVSDDELWLALEHAQAADFVHAKEGGLNAAVDSFGRNFSGGQRQRLTMARALLKQSPFLILDDATSALDYLTEAKLFKTITEEYQDVTLVLVSQRTRSLAIADKILVLDKGRQVGLGRHDELLDNCPIYRDIHLSQNQEEVSDEN